MGRPRKYNTRQLTEHLRQLAAEAHDWSMEDGAITKGEALARLLWKKALGWTEQTTDDEGNQKEVYHKPESWAIQLVYDRIEGKVPQAEQEQDEANKRRAKEAVRQLAKDRLNEIASKATTGAGALKKKGPPKRKGGDNA